MKVMKLEIRKCFSLYINGEAIKVPQKPEFDGDLIQYKDGMQISVGKTVLGKELTWFCVQFNTGTEVWFCDRNLISQISWSCLPNMNLTGRQIQIEGRTMELSLPSVGGCEDTDCEWTALMDFLDNDPENSFHWKNCFSFGENIGEDLVALRGFSGARNWDYDYSFSNIRFSGWRPALRILTTEKTCKLQGFESILKTEYSERFDEIRKKAMINSFYKYEPVKDNYGKYKCMDALGNLLKRVEKYKETGNTEFLADAANFAMIEFMNPSIKGAGYHPTSTDACDIVGFSVNEIRNHDKF